jgi:hypothetical protein
MTRLIEDNIVQALVTYLKDKPYVEVFQVLPILQNLPIAPLPQLVPDAPALPPEEPTP